MNIKEMHYDFKTKLNKLDSQQYRNLNIVEIDWLLNEAQEIFIKKVAVPRIRSFRGFEKTQRSIDDIRTLILDSECPLVDGSTDLFSLPPNYWHYIRGRVTMSQGICSSVKGTLKIRQHDDEFEDSPFDSSSYKWRIVNGVFKGNTIKLYINNFTVSKLEISYIKRPLYIHNAEDFRSNNSSGSYNDLSGNTLTGTQDSELPEHTHREIVDIAVLIATNNLQIPDYQIKQQKLQMNNLN